jgi:orotidine-5'-phosphate decarboxylase
VGLGDTPDGLDRFADIALEAAVGTVGLVKLQSAFYERHRWRGFRTLQRLIAEARSAGLLVIVDAKRGDVGTTKVAYAKTFLGDDAPLAADALTVHPYLGLAAMDAFVTRACEAGSCLLVVTRSSNPEGRSVQSALDGSGRTVEEALLCGIGEPNARLAERSGRSSVPPTWSPRLPSRPRTVCSWRRESGYRVRRATTWPERSRPARSGSCQARLGRCSGTVLM